jgi:hypothetical protein
MKTKTKKVTGGVARLEGMGDGSGKYPKTSPALETPPVWKIWRPTSGTSLNQDGTIVFDMTTNPDEVIL